eukprot:1083107-Prymnesium_polylepis.1
MPSAPTRNDGALTLRSYAKRGAVDPVSEKAGPRCAEPGVGGESTRRGARRVLSWLVALEHSAELLELSTAEIVDARPTPADP